MVDQAMIDKYRVNAWSKRKEAIDRHLESFQKGAKPPINIDAVVFWAIVLMVVVLMVYLRVTTTCECESKPRAEPSSLQTKCTQYDIRDGQKYCLRWKRV